jgi:hypothetical protein
MHALLNIQASIIWTIIWRTESFGMDLRHRILQMTKMSFSSARRRNHRGDRIAQQVNGETYDL